MTKVTSSWHTYPKIYNIGHTRISDLLHGEFIVEEKVDGSQFSFGLFEDGYRIRSKGVVMPIDCPEKMFVKAAEVVKTLNLRPGWTYRGEYLSKPKHNTLAYNRIPNNHIIIFDINDGEESYLPYYRKIEEAERIGLEVVPRIEVGELANVDQFKSLLQRESILGGVNVEGVVIKNYQRFIDGKVMMGKYVSEAFKEIHQGEWKTSNPTKNEVIALLINELGTPARWAKSVQHLKERGHLEGAPQDIGKLMAECQKDVADECKEYISEKILAWAMPQIVRGCVKGLPQWYKDELAKTQFPQ